MQVDAQLIDANTGKRIGTEEKPVEEALKAYFRHLPFNGIIRKTALEDAIQAIPGVTDLKTESLRGAKAFAHSYQPASGHAQLADTATFSYQTALIA